MVAAAATALCPSFFSYIHTRVQHQRLKFAHSFCARSAFAIKLIYLLTKKKKNCGLCLCDEKMLMIDINLCVHIKSIRKYAFYLINVFVT